MPHMLKAGMVLHLGLHHGMFWGGSASLAPSHSSILSGSVIVIIIVGTSVLVHKVCGAFVLMRAAILHRLRCCQRRSVA